MGPSNISYLSDTARFHFNDYGEIIFFGGSKMAPRKCVGDFSTNLGMPNQNPGLNSKAPIRVKAAQEFLKWSHFYPTVNGRNPAPPGMYKTL